MSMTYDVAVLGAGFAGVTAARELGLRGARCVILEARDRIGGRTWSSEFLGKPVELGGAWIHWAQPHVWAEVTRYGLPLSESTGAIAPERCIAVTADGERREVEPEKLFNEVAASFERLCEGSRELFARPFEPLAHEGLPRTDALSAADRMAELRLPEPERDALRALVSTLFSAPCADAGLANALRWYALANWSFPLLMDAVVRYKLRDGTRALLEAMLADGRAELRLSTPVVRVRRDDRGVALETASGEIVEARVAIVSVPLNVLRDIEFTPALESGKRAAAEEGQASRGAKVWALLRKAPESFFALAPDPAPLTWLQSEEVLPQGTLCIGFAPDGAALNPASRDSVAEAVRPFLPDAEVVAVTGHDWLGDSCSRGTWPVFRPRQLTSCLRDLQRPEGRFVFAGSESADGWSGFIDGAIETGLRAARETRRFL